MITVLKKIGDTYHLRKDEEIRLEDTFFYDAASSEKTVKRKVTEIVEQRPERRTDKKKGFFARVKQEPVAA